MILRNTKLAFAAGLSLLASTALAQVKQPMRIRATIEKVDGDKLELKARDGHQVVVTLTSDVRVTGVANAKIDEIKPGSFIGTAAVSQPDGSLKALEVHVFPPSMKGTGEGSYAWDLGNNSSMTNGTVGDLVVSNGRTMTVKYGSDGEKKITVPEDVPIVSLEPKDRSLIVAGAHVVVVATEGTDGALTANRINVGENGTVPPM